MSFVDNRLEQMRAECEAFHRAHPEVWEAFVRLTFDRIGRGFKHYGSMAIFQRIRWELAEVGEDGTDAFKINNNFAPFYGRRFMRAFPEHAGFFRTRRQPSELEPPVDLPPLRPSHFDDRPQAGAL